jgi:hypothetical protein
VAYVVQKRCTELWYTCRPLYRAAAASAVVGGPYRRRSAWFALLTISTLRSGDSFPMGDADRFATSEKLSTWG